MSTTGMLPPQAYTRETLARAVEWLNTQPQVVREKATSADALIALFLQTKRRGVESPPSNSGWSGSNDAPSVEAFKADLKNLAEGLRAFEGSSEPQPQLIHAPPQPIRAEATGIGGHQAPTLTASAPNVALALDMTTRLMLEEVRKRLNLSSEGEALRALVAIGFERLRDLLPRT